MICADCRAEVRFGWRHDRPGWWHREDVDHEARPVVVPETHEPIVIPEPDEACVPIDIDFLPPRSGMRQIATLLTKTPGWHLRRMTRSVGPYVGSKAEVLSTSESIVIAGNSDPGLDGTRRAAVASWRDRDFDFAFIADSTGTRLVNSADLKAWIKEPYAAPTLSPEGDHRP